MANQLTARQEEVLESLTANAGNVKATAEALKCSDVNVYRIINNAAVQEQLVINARNLLSTHIIPAVGTIARLSQTAKSEFIQLEASKAILDRVGLAEPKQDQVLAIQINLDTTE